MSGDSTGTVLAVFVHPDDETLLAGALIAKLVDDGWRVHLLCVAPGDDDDLATRMELAASELGIESVSSLRFAPAGARSTGRSVASPPLLSAPESVVASQVAGKIASLAPDRIITHSPSGDYGHADHAYCHRVTVAAASEAATGADVYALAWSRSMLRLNRMAGRVFGLLGRSVEDGSQSVDAATAALELPVTETHDVSRYLGVRKRAASHYRKELSKGPLPLRMLEAAPTCMQRPALGKARLSRVR